jgi:hypothetical protein
MAEAVKGPGVLPRFPLRQHPGRRQVAVLGSGPWRGSRAEQGLPLGPRVDKTVIKDDKTRLPYRRTLSCPSMM